MANYSPGIIRARCVLPTRQAAVTNLLIPFNNTIPTNGTFNFSAAKTGAAKTGAAPFLDFSDGTPTIQSISATPTVTGAPPRVTTLRLPQNEVGTLTYLDLNSNQIAAIPTEIGSLTALTYLGLNNNQIAAIPTEIGSLTTLTYLDLSRNQITAIPSQIGGLTALTDLYLGNNQITAIPSQIGSLTALTSLSLYNNQITATEIIAFAQLVAANSAWDNCSINLTSNPGSASAAVDAGFITAKATLEGRGCTVTI